MNTPNSPITSQQVIKGQAIYTKLALNFYDLTVLNISNNYLWGCPSSHIQSLYQKNISYNHLEVGVGTGYFLQHCRFEKSPRIALMDLNQNCLDVAAKRLSIYNPKQYKKNIYEPIELSTPLFDSLGINYVLHCLPGDIHTKAIVLRHLKALLNPNAVVFGSTILGKGVRLNPMAQLITKIYNSKGVFSNLQDDLDGLKVILENNFSSCQVQTIGCVALFSAWV